MISDRHMPRPWFRAQTCLTSMMFLRPRQSQFRQAPLSEGERQLGWFVLPPFQRPPVWSEKQKIRFIESAWAGLPLGVFVFNRPASYGHPCENWLLDGQQRVTAVLDYMNDAFPVLGILFSELRPEDRRRWDMSVIFSGMETSLTDRSELEDIYDRLAYGGTAHEPKPEAHGLC